MTEARWYFYLAYRATRSGAGQEWVWKNVPQYIQDAAREALKARCGKLWPVLS